MGFRFDMILVERAPCWTGDESFPDPRIVLSESERVLARPPFVEVSNNGDMFCVWCPHCKMGSILSIELGWMGAEFFVEFEVFSFFEEVDIVCRLLLVINDRVHCVGDSGRDGFGTMAKPYDSA